MGIFDLIRRHSHSTGKGGSTAHGIPPAGTRIPATGDGHTRTNRKVKVTYQPAQQPKRHRR